jgi:hypothetical protein
MLEKIAVIAGDLHDEAVRPEHEPLGDHVTILPSVLHPARGVGREVGIFFENALRPDILLELDQKALVADEDAERKVRLHPVDLVGRHEGLAQGRHAEVDEDVLQAQAAKAAMGMVVWTADTYEAGCMNVHRVLAAVLAVVRGLCFASIARASASSACSS